VGFSPLYPPFHWYSLTPVKLNHFSPGFANSRSNEQWNSGSITCDDVSFTYNMATVDSPSVILLYSSYCDGNSKESLLLPDQGLQKGLFICYQENLMVLDPSYLRTAKTSTIISKAITFLCDPNRWLWFRCFCLKCIRWVFLVPPFLNTSNPIKTGLKPPLKLGWANRVWPSL